MRKLKDFHYLSFQIGVLTGVIIAFTLAAVAIKNSNLFVQKSSESQLLLTESFDFRSIRTSDKNWRGPNLGEKIDLSQLKTVDGKSLAETVKTSHIVLVTIDPECAICNVSGDLINSVREGLKPVKIEYYPVYFAHPEDSNKTDQFAMSLGFQSKTFTWEKDGELPPENLQNIVTPSHLLLDNTGRVLQVWAGSSREKNFRERMSHQIIADIITIEDTLTALER